MGGINLVGWLSGFRSLTDSVANWRYATFVRRLGEAAAPGGRECGSCPDFASYTLAFALQLKKNHGRTSVRVKNNWDEIFGVFIRENVWPKNSLSQSEEGLMGRGRVRVEIQAVEGKDTKWRPVVRM